MDILQFVYPFIIDGRLGNSRQLAIVNSATTKIHIEGFLRLPVLNFGGCIPRSGIVGITALGLMVNLCLTF